MTLFQTPKTRWSSRFLAHLSAAVATVKALPFDASDLLFLLGLLLVGLGFQRCWTPGAFLVPGLVLLWVYLPARRPFIDPPAPLQSPARRK